MACPMRFVLAGISAILAFILVWRNSAREGQGKTPVRLEVFGNKSWGRILLDFFTGRFLLDIYRIYGSGNSLSSHQEKPIQR